MLIAEMTHHAFVPRLPTVPTLMVIRERSVPVSVGDDMRASQLAEGLREAGPPVEWHFQIAYVPRGSSDDNCLYRSAEFGELIRRQSALTYIRSRASL